MGRFTDEMTRLVGEIVDLRGARKGFVKDLTQNTAALMANFHRAHRDMARKTKAERRAAAAHLKKTVSAMRHAFAADLDGARRAWAGK
jgi:molybdenum-dependent DNA-binding transcriptional regulator ModE